MTKEQQIVTVSLEVSQETNEQVNWSRDEATNLVNELKNRPDNKDAGVVSLLPYQAGYVVWGENSVGQVYVRTRSGAEIPLTLPYETD